MASNVTLQTPAALQSVSGRLGMLFYIVDPRKTSFQSPEEVPHYFQQVWPYFVAFIVLENLILWLQRKPAAGLNESVTSISHGIIQECGRMLFRGAEGAAYIYLYNNWRLVDLPWDSSLTWYLAALGVDFGYYWVHRASHEIHILWAQHQVHHSSEEFNLAVGLRQSILQGWCGFAVYLPLALVIPPAQFLTHQQLNLIYQFWIHTDVVKSLGPLEWVLNTPRHHRVHHGCNLYCLDKNYGGLLIIWDRIFGTFAEEKPKEKLVFGLVFQPHSFNPLYLQVFYNKNVVNKFRAMSGVWNKISSVIKGPSWLPGKPWTGADEDKIDIRERQAYCVQLPFWLNAYLLGHFALTLLSFQELMQRHAGMSAVSVLIGIVYIISSITSIGMLFDGSPAAPIFELSRCVAFLLVETTMVYRWAFTASACIWAACISKGM